MTPAAPKRSMPRRKATPRTTAAPTKGLSPNLMEMLLNISSQLQTTEHVIKDREQMERSSTHSAGAACSSHDRALTVKATAASRCPVTLSGLQAWLTWLIG